jgi:hypothetical protein
MNSPVGVHVQARRIDVVELGVRPAPGQAVGPQEGVGRALVVVQQDTAAFVLVYLADAPSVADGREESLASSLAHRVWVREERQCGHRLPNCTVLRGGNDRLQRGAAIELEVNERPRAVAGLEHRPGSRPQDDPRLRRRVWRYRL